MDDPLMLTAATTLVAWTTTNLAEGARSAVAELTEFLRRRFRRDAASRETVEVALRQPTADALHRLAALLEQEARRDAAFGAEFRARVAEVQTIVADGHADVTNTVSGDVSGPVVQARDIHGGITFGSSHS
ncbi:hypothetical protein O7605_26045 [Verrucosispora sp. WMMA2121]|uniref:hypothetical protein n=1 Tax=Verrucosispora sp. WMMA2121 TaxID=3015164 RepID=UPI0022B66DAD|nr:hypothetical protein [Verrucosispora sp. WMMA2121]MCZ7422970.1 hypothetical protein [Verrucosispora sp. WMMA2121]